MRDSEHPLPAAALDLIELDRNWVTRRGSMSLPERVALLLSCCGGSDPALITAAKALACHVELIGIEAAQHGRELTYHNREHIHDVLISWAFLCATGQTELDSDCQLTVMTAMIGHDLCHDGTFNKHPYQLEKQAWRDIAPLLQRAGVAERKQRVIMAIVLATDPHRYRRLSAGPIDTTLRRGMSLAVDADLFASILPRNGFAAGNRLASESRKAGMGANAGRLATLEGRSAFLRSLPRLSSAMKSCGMEVLINHQIKVIDSLSVSDRALPWHEAWGEAFSHEVQASLAKLSVSTALVGDDFGN